MTAGYNYQKRPLSWKITEKIKGGKHKEECNAASPPILVSVSSPFYRQETMDYCGKFLLSSYSGKNAIFNTCHAPASNEDPHYRVHQLCLPVGQDDTFTSVYELDYQPPIAGQKEGTTTVKNSDGTSIVYHFSKNLLTTAVHYFGKDGNLKKESSCHGMRKIGLSPLK